MEPVIRTVDLPIKTTLTDIEQKLVLTVGRSRQDKNDRAGIRNLKVDHKQGDWEAHMAGFGAELALCKMLGVYPDLDTTPRRGGIDCTLQNGQTIDVKSTKAEHGRLIAPVTMDRLEAHADIAILVITNKAPTYYAVGWLPMADLLDPKNIQEFGPKNVPTHVVERGMLDTKLYLVAPPPWEHVPFLDR